MTSIFVTDSVRFPFFRLVWRFISTISVTTVWQSPYAPRPPSAHSSNIAKNNPGKSTLLRYLGADEELDPDFTWVRLRRGDRLLLCSDGLTGMIEDEGIAQVLASSDTLETCCRTLVDRANEAGGKDNITAVLVRLCQRTTHSGNGDTPREDAS